MFWETKIREAFVAFSHIREGFLVDSLRWTLKDVQEFKKDGWQRGLGWYACMEQRLSVLECVTQPGTGTGHRSQVRRFWEVTLHRAQRENGDHLMAEWELRDYSAGGFWVIRACLGPGGIRGEQCFRQMSLVNCVMEIERGMWLEVAGGGRQGEVTRAPAERRFGGKWLMARDIRDWFDKGAKDTE